MEDNKEMEQLEQELLDSEAEDLLLEELFLRSEGASFDEPETDPEPEIAPVRRNTGRNPAKRNGGDREMAKQKNKDKILIALMATACLLCLGIIGILLYWLEVLLK